MKVAYIFATQRHNVSYVLAKMILPQLEENRHGADVVGMFFFEDNNYVLVDGNPIGARLHKVAKEKGMLLMGCDQCCYEREIADKLFPGVPIAASPTSTRRSPATCLTKSSPFKAVNHRLFLLWNLRFPAALTDVNFRSEAHHVDDRPYCHSDPGASRLPPDLGLQPKLGLWTRRRPGADIDHCNHPDADRQGLTRGALSGGSSARS
jgi:hypothetical protein